MSSMFFRLATGLFPRPISSCPAERAQPALRLSSTNRGLRASQHAGPLGIRWLLWLGPPAIGALYPFLWGRVPLLDYSKKGTLILTSLLEDLVWIFRLKVKVS